MNLVPDNLIRIDKNDPLTSLKISWPISLVLALLFGSVYFAYQDLQAGAVLAVLAAHQIISWAIIRYSQNVRKVKDPLFVSSLLHSVFIGAAIFFSGGFESSLVALFLAWIFYLAIFSDVNQLKKATALALGFYLIAALGSTGLLAGTGDFNFAAFAFSVFSILAFSIATVSLKQSIDLGQRRTNKLEQEFESRIKDLAKASKVQTKLSEIQETDPLLQVFAQEIKEITKSSTVLIYLKDGPDGDYCCRRSLGESAKLYRGSKTNGENDLAFEEIDHLKKPLIFAKKDTKIVLANLSKKTELKNALLLPLFKGENVVGVVCCLNKKSAFDESDLGLMGTICSQISVLLQNTEQFEEIRAKSVDLEKFNAWHKKNRKAIINILEDVNRANSELEKALAQTMTMYRIAVELSKSLNEEQLLDAIILHSARLVQAKKGSLIVMRGPKLYQATVHNKASDLHLELADSPIYWVAKNKKSIAINDFSRTTYKDFSRLTNIKNLLAVPLVQSNKCLGVLCLIDKKEGFSVKDSQALETLAHQATVTLLNARIHDREKKTIAKLKEVDKMKADFVASVSHELRSPLTTIKGYLDLVTEGEAGPLTQEQTDFLGIVDQSSTRLLNLINDLLTVAKIESDGLQITRQLLSINDVLESVAKTITPQIKQKKLNFKMGLSKQNVMINGDFDRLEQVVINFISNAIKFTASGGTIELISSVKSNAMIVGVKDTGIGISAADKKRLFDKFFRSQEAIIQHVKGTGLGLAIAKGIVEKHQGKIWVESTPGKGSTFFFSLPIKKRTAA